MGLEKVQGCILPKNNMFWDKVHLNLFFGQFKVSVRHASWFKFGHKLLREGPKKIRAQGRIRRSPLN